MWAQDAGTSLNTHRWEWSGSIQRQWAWLISLLNEYLCLCLLSPLLCLPVFFPSLFSKASLFFSLIPLFIFLSFSLSLSRLHANAHTRRQTVMNTWKSKAWSSYGLVLRASKVMRGKNRLTENNIEIGGDRTSSELADGIGLSILVLHRRLGLGQSRARKQGSEH